MSYIKFGLFLGIVISIVLLILFGLLHIPTPDAVDLGSSKRGIQKRQCNSQKVFCTGKGSSVAESNQWCSDNCNEGVEMVCTKINDNDDNSICSPKTAKINCNGKLGGVLAWESTIPGASNMDWGCICSAPNIAAAIGYNGPGDDTPLCQANPNICGGPNNIHNFTWDSDATKTKEPWEYCKCPADNTLMVTRIGNNPVCVPTDLQKWYMDTLKLPPPAP
jgi:hypothetical protein